jgi:hypothetical protein
MGRTACTEPQCLYKGDLYLYLYIHYLRKGDKRCIENEVGDFLEK